MKKAFSVLLSVLFAVTMAAQESRSAYNFLRLPVSSHAAALGGVNISIIEDDPSLTFSNPALLSSVSDKSVNLNFMTYMEGAKNAAASFCKTVGDNGSWALLARLTDYGTLAETAADGTETGTFTAKDIAIGGTFSYILSPKLSGGITARLVSSRIGDYSSLAAAVDLGLNYYDPDREWSVSLTAKNLGGQLKAYDDEYEHMPFDLQAGASKELNALPVRVSATLIDLTNWDYKLVNHLIVGADILLSQQVYVAAGYSFRRADEMRLNAGSDKESAHWAGFSVGAGLQLERFKLHAAYGKYHVSASSLSVSVTYSL